MNVIYNSFLQILRSALMGVQVAPLPELSKDDWATLIHLAVEQKILPLFYEAVYTQAPLSDLRSTVRHQVMMQTIKTDEFLKLYQKWTDAGVNPIVVKGIICRSLYNKPDHRPSSDEDILVSPDELVICQEVLERFGVKTSDEGSDSYELPYRKSNSPLYIELHKSFFSPQSDAYGHWNKLFDHVFESCHMENIQGIAVRTLSPTDHLLYLICHALKHFVHSGFGIRQVCDMVLFANRWGNAIDWKYLMEACDSINAVSFTAAIFRIGEAYLNFDAETACYPDFWRAIEVDPAEMLDDLFSSGIYGTSSINRVHSSNITLDAVAADQGQGSGKSSILGSVFPSADKLVGQYPYLSKHPWLLPVAWTQRIAKYGREMKSSGAGGAVESIKIGTQRVELLKRYGVIK